MIFKEVKSCFINREHVAVLVLALSFIERRFQESLHINGFEKESKESLNKILKRFKGNSSIPDYFIERVDFLRLKRNPFVHLRDINDENNLNTRSSVNKEKVENILEKDAKEAIGLMLESLRIRVL
jgi:CRISPR/Cas system-associated protein Csx1